MRTAAAKTGDLPGEPADDPLLGGGGARYRFFGRRVGHARPGRAGRPDEEAE